MAALAIAGAGANALGENRLFSIPVAPQDGTVDLGSGDTGILNYAYALEQLEAAYYTQVMSAPYAGMTAEERQILTDLRDHEIVHREFFKVALGANAIPALVPDFGKVNFNSRASVLKTAQIFEDLGVSAYNGAGQLLTDPQNLLLAGKIVSVEARHAAAIRDLLKPRSDSFAPKPLDVERSPGTVLKLAGLFIKTKISGDNLPKA
ncbi:MAG: ferritin-like domain-containing protein [Pyrinomonadaceae bacterium]|nr:ferritin-like domain-containing protein [Pyrinomonadaceae bacterium]